MDALLIRKMVDVYAVNDSGETPLCFTMLYGTEEIDKLLVNKNIVVTDKEIKECKNNK